MGRLAKTEEQRARNREYQRRWREANLEVQRARVAANSKRLKEQARAYVAKVKQAGCSRCSENHPACLDFHHLDATTKERGIAQMISRGVGIPKLVEEISKCELLCSNCHRKLHYEGA